MLIDAVKPALEDRKIPLDGIGIDVAANVFLGFVHDGAMRCEVPANAGVNARLVGHETAIAVRVPPNQWTEHLRGDVRNMEAADAAIALDQCHDGLFRRGFFLGAASGIPTDKSFVGLYGLASTAKRRSKQATVFFHSFTDAMASEPCGLHATI
jgi:hypothetical protein